MAEITLPDRVVMTPGPVAVPKWVLNAMEQPPLHHRSKEFQLFFRSLQKELQYYFQTNESIACLAGSGTAGMEATVFSLSRIIRSCLIPIAGKFGDRWATLAKAYGIETSVLRKEWGEEITVEEILEKLRIGIPPDAILLTHSETSTGVVLDLETLAFELRQAYPDMLIIVDGITSVGVLPFYMDAWGIDLALVASHKSLLSPAGAVFAAVSSRLASRLEPEAHYFSLGTYLAKGKENFSPYTPPVYIWYGVKAVLEHIRETTLPVIWNRTLRRHRITTHVILRSGGTIVAKDHVGSVTAFAFPGIEMDAFRERLLQDFGIQLAGGQEKMKGKIARIGHFSEVPEGTYEKLPSIIEQTIAQCRNR